MALRGWDDTGKRSEKHPTVSVAEIEETVDVWVLEKTLIISGETVSGFSGF